MAGCGVKKWNIQEIHDRAGLVVFHTTGRKQTRSTAACATASRPWRWGCRLCPSMRSGRRMRRNSVLAPRLSTASQERGDMRLSDGELRWMQARLAQRYAAAGRDAQEKLERQLAVLAPDQALLTSWCYAASPLSDWANYDFSLFRSCAAHALHLWEQSPSVRALTGTAVSELCPPSARQ